MIWETILGGLTGLLGNVLTAWSAYKTQQLKNGHDEAMYDFKIQEISAKTDATVKIAEAKIAGAIEVADSTAYTESQKHGNVKLLGDTWVEKLLMVKGWASYITVPVAVVLIILLGCVDVIKGIMRPGLTLYLTAVTTWITWKAYTILCDEATILTAKQAVALYSEVTAIVVYLTVSCVTWWFGDRRMAKFLARVHAQRTNDSVSLSLPDTIDSVPNKEEYINTSIKEDNVIPK